MYMLWERTVMGISVHTAETETATPPYYRLHNVHSTHVHPTSDPTAKGHAHGRCVSDGAEGGGGGGSGTGGGGEGGVGGIGVGGGGCAGEGGRA